jgi:hypothetical protein
VGPRASKTDPNFGSKIAVTGVGVTFALSLLCHRFAFALPSLCFYFTSALLLFCFCFALALPSYPNGGDP